MSNIFNKALAFLFINLNFPGSVPWMPRSSMPGTRVWSASPRARTMTGRCPWGWGWWWKSRQSKLWSISGKKIHLWQDPRANSHAVAGIWCYSEEHCFRYDGWDFYFTLTLFYYLFLDVLSGYNGTIFAYGQTSSGKTHTMEAGWNILSET